MKNRINIYNSIRLIFILYYIIFSNKVRSQEDFITVQLENTFKNIEIPVTFLEKEPQIDGILDNTLETLPIRNFNLANKWKCNEIVNTHYRLGYGINFFYLYIEAESDQLIYRERAYQFGDGFMLILAKPKMNNKPADEYYEIAASAHNNPKYEFPNLFLSALNLNRIFLEIGSDSKLKYNNGEGKISFEILIPWKDIKPYYPFVCDTIGFNLLFNKAVSNDSDSFIRYQIVEEDRIPFTKRNYIILGFQKPELVNKSKVYLYFNKGHIFEGDSLNLSIVSLCNKNCNDKIIIDLQSNDTILKTVSKSVKYKKGLVSQELSIPIVLKPGKYILKWSSKVNQSFKETQSITVLPNFDKELLKNKLSKSTSIVSKHSISTIQFQMNELENDLQLLKEYESGEIEYKKLEKLTESVIKIEKGIDPFNDKKGFIRKAYLSKFDNTLQPYVVYIPEDYNKNKKYPLFVFLHGSEMTEISIKGAKDLIPKGFIGLGPLGRGPSNGYTINNAQVDIKESIEAVKEQYAIDESNIVLAGFSMGGYGVLRTYWETPKTYKALAIFSGGPDMGKMFSKGIEAPNFLEDSNLIVFKNTPIFIHHGEKDLNAPCYLMEKLVFKLDKTGAKVEFIVDPEKAHEAPSLENRDKFFEWIKLIIK